MPNPPSIYPSGATSSDLYAYNLDQGAGYTCRPISDPKCIIEINTLRCCGVKELSRLGISFENGVLERDLLTVAFVLQGVCAFAMFTGATSAASSLGEAKYAVAFKDLIAKEGFGTVVTLPPQINPNSLHILTPYLWALNRDAIKDRMAKEKEARKEVETLNDILIQTAVISASL